PHLQADRLPEPPARDGAVGVALADARPRLPPDHQRAGRPRLAGARRRRRRPCLPLFEGEAAHQPGELGVLADQQPRQEVAEVVATAPLAQVVLPRVPAPPLLRGHVLVVEEDVGALEEGDQQLEEDEAPLLLLVIKCWRRRERW